jgi:ATP-dependent protease ClpP protease subunit
MKLKYTHYIDSDEPVMLINKHIGMDDEDGEGIMGPQFQQEIMYVDTLNKKRIKVLICSPGGNVMDGMQIYNSILTTKTKVDTFNTGVAASIAGVIFQAGRKRYMSDYALLMMHNPFHPSATGATPELDAFKGSIVKMLARKNPNTTEEAISDFMNNTTWMKADDAMKQGFCDEIEYSSDMNKPRAINAPSDAKAAWKQYANYLNSIHTNPTNPNTMKKLYNKLKLVDGANEDAVIASIEVIENRATVAEAAKAELTSQLNTANTELTNAKNKVTELENTLSEIKRKEDEEKKTALENAATLLVENLAKVGKIKNDAATLADVKAKAIKDFEGTKSLFEAMPLNRKGAEIINKVGNAENKAKYTMGAQMIVIQNANK